MDKKQYVYIGQYYHIKNKDLPLDYKFGVTNNLDKREHSLGSTKSPIKYMILRAWELPTNVKREKVEKIISLFFDDCKYDGCEWYDIDGDTFQDKIKELFDVISDMVVDTNFTFNEVDLDKKTSGDIIEREIEKEIRNGVNSKISIDINGKIINGDSAKVVYYNAINEIIKYVSPIRLCIDFPKIIKSNKNDYPDYKISCNGILDIGDFYLDTHMNNGQKKRYIKYILDFYKISGNVE